MISAIEVIEPTAVIGPDGTLRTGWERPRFTYEYEFITDQVLRFKARSAFGAALTDPRNICNVSGGW